MKNINTSKFEEVILETLKEKKLKLTNYNPDSEININKKDGGFRLDYYDGGLIIKLIYVTDPEEKGRFLDHNIGEIGFTPDFNKIYVKSRIHDSEFHLMKYIAEKIEQNPNFQYFPVVYISRNQEGD